ncbi:MAG: 4-(cytidine 5'-diphospho)-2-C-methyl-D-erythritol kinase [Syntrophales bacterium]|nr:4-(cytidine 5'-diphospho)-2-C-methyl-D-erythritol kinase [Syntrophales bacterium]
MRRLSPAKVNLHLKVLRKRPDGYHDLQTLMQPITLFDELRFVKRKKGIQLKCLNSNLPTDRNNLVYRAAELILSHSGWPFGVEIDLVKRIPVAAGLGGGSSNAATTLLTINEMINNRWNTEELMKMGAMLGADVPFFVLGKTAWALGIGDELIPCEECPFIYYLLINPGFPLSTALVYEKLNLGLTNRRIHYSIPRFLRWEDIISGLSNDLEDVSIKMYPIIGKLKELLMDHGALGTLMTGSGPTVFGIFDREEALEKARKELINKVTGQVYTASSLKIDTQVH